MKNKLKNTSLIMGLVIILSSLYIITPEQTSAGSYDGLDLAQAILQNQSSLIRTDYWDRDRDGCRQSIILSSMGTMMPTDGSTFILLSTGIAGADPVTTDGLHPGDERGTWFKNRYGQPRDQASLTLTLQVPKNMHYLYYDAQFFSAEYPEYVGTRYNDKLTVTVESPSQGTTQYVCDVNSGDFILDSHDLIDTGFDIFAQSGNPPNVDWVTTNPNPTGADAGATALITRGHPVSPNEEITVTFKIRDEGDNLFDSTAFIDNLMFAGFAKTDITARKTVTDLNGGDVECGDTLEYSITISNSGDYDQFDNDGDEFTDFIPENTTFVPGSTTATSGLIIYDSNGDKITWNGQIPTESSVALLFRVTVDMSLINGYEISNQGTIFWDSDGDSENDEFELTDDPTIDDGIDLDGDGETNDDDPTNLIVVSFEPPLSVTEDFSDDSPGGNATEEFFNHTWFETSESLEGSVFEVVSGYQYTTSNAFKTQVRMSSSPFYWDYSVSDLGRDMESWEIWFACGSTSEAADLYLDFKNNNDNDIARLKFEYKNEGEEPPVDWVLELSFWDPTNGWTKLASTHPGGYLLNNWYHLKIEKNETAEITYSLYRHLVGHQCTLTAPELSAAFENFAYIEWYSTQNPDVCPMFFWDQHKLGLV